jgi:hypothetical protein
MWKADKIVKLTVGASVGNWIADAWILKAGPADEGFVDMEPGFGMDDVVRGITVAVSILTLEQVF